MALAQVGAWLRLSLDAVPLARAPLPTEAARAAVIAALPALVLGIGVHSVLDEWRLRPPVFLLVPPALAATGTIVLATFGAALAMRLRRRERPHLGRRQE